jgi:putative Holliday junction resolvase
MEDEKPRIMALDVGSKRTGVALSDETRTLGTPFDTIITGDQRELVHKVAKLVEQKEVGRLVVGVPLNQFGEDGVDAIKVKQFIALLREKVKEPVIEWDERFTTLQAERTLLTADLSRDHRRKVIDKVAAALILQSYLDSLQFHREPSDCDDE